MAPDGGPSPAEKKALLDLRARLEESLRRNHLPLPSPTSSHRLLRRRRTGRLAAAPSSNSDLQVVPLVDLSLWGVPLLPSVGHPSTDLILLKFLRARSLDPMAALSMLARTLRWRCEFGADAIADEEIGPPGLMEGFLGRADRLGNPVCYSMCRVVGVLAEEEEERLIWLWVWLMERAIREMKLGNGGNGGTLMVLNVIDLGAVEAKGVKEVQEVMGRVVQVLQDNYPEFVERNIFVNVSFRYYAHHALFSRFLTQRTKSKFIFARPSKVAETLLKFVAPENLPVQYGGFKREVDDEFPDDHGEVFEISVRAGGHDTIEIRIPEPGVTIVWDVIVVGWDVSYKEEFIPDDECSYKVLIQRERRLEENVRNSFYISEPGKVVLTIVNSTFKRTKTYYRWKSKPTVPVYKIPK